MYTLNEILTNFQSHHILIAVSLLVILSFILIKTVINKIKHPSCWSLRFGTQELQRNVLINGFGIFFVVLVGSFARRLSGILYNYLCTSVASYYMIFIGLILNIIVAVAFGILIATVIKIIKQDRVLNTRELIICGVTTVIVVLGMNVIIKITCGQLIEPLRAAISDIICMKVICKLWSLEDMKIGVGDTIVDKTNSDKSINRTTLYANRGESSKQAGGPSTQAGGPSTQAGGPSTQQEGDQVESGYAKRQKRQRDIAERMALNKSFDWKTNPVGSAVGYGVSYLTTLRDDLCHLVGPGSGMKNYINGIYGPDPSLSGVGSEARYQFPPKLCKIPIRGVLRDDQVAATISYWKWQMYQSANISNLLERELLKEITLYNNSVAVNPLLACHHKENIKSLGTKLESWDNYRNSMLNNLEHSSFNDVIGTTSAREKSTTLDAAHWIAYNRSRKD